LYRTLPPQTLRKMDAENKSQLVVKKSASPPSSSSKVTQDQKKADDFECDFLFVISMDKSFARRLIRLQREAMFIQYNIAVLSTLGGAHHLCNKPESALVLACQQEMVARRLGSSSLIVRSKVFQAVNLGLLKRKRQANAMFQHCEELAQHEEWTGMSSFVAASKNWLKMELKLQADAGSHSSSRSSNRNSNRNSNRGEEENKSSSVSHSHPFPDSSPSSSPASSSKSSPPSSARICRGNALFPQSQAVEELK
jgi:hypothetical protein